MHHKTQVQIYQDNWHFVIADWKVNTNLHDWLLNDIMGTAALAYWQHNLLLNVKCIRSTGMVQPWSPPCRWLKCATGQWSMPWFFAAQALPCSRLYTKILPTAPIVAPPTKTPTYPAILWPRVPKNMGYIHIWLWDHLKDADTQSNLINNIFNELHSWQQ